MGTDHDKEEKFKSLKKLVYDKLEEYYEERCVIRDIYQSGDYIPDIFWIWFRWKEYGYLLMKLLESDEAPFDGGGPLTPWPQKPITYKEIIDSYPEYYKIKESA